MSDGRANPLLVAAAIVYGAAGVALTFAPAEALAAAGEPAGPVATWVAQAFGAALLGFAWLDWIQRGQRVHGIYGRTVALPNLLFAMVAALEALGAWRRAPGSPALLVAAGVLGLFAMAFGAALFRRGTPGD